MAEQTDFDPERVVVRDRRRLDPHTGQVKETAGAPDGSPLPPAAPADAAPETAAEPQPDRVAELTETLQRLQAEYANYRKRVERDRLAVVETATAGLLSALLPVLDDVDRARQHGDLDGAFKSVGEALEGVTAKFGLERFGSPGEPFDPQVHEAVMQAEPDPAFTVATCAQVFQPGFRANGRVLRPARVAVAEPGA